MITRLGVFVCAISLMTATVHGDVIYDNGGPDATSGGGNGTLFQSLNPDFVSFDDFVLSPGASTITDIHWWGNYFLSFEETVEDAFVLYIFEDDTGAPDFASAPLHVIDGSATTRVDTGLDVGGDTDIPIFAYELFIDPIVLDPGVVYWLGIGNDFHWRWQTSLVSGTAFTASGNNLEDSFAGASVAGLDFGLAFNLTDTVIPEPSTVLLVGAGIAALAARRRFSGRTK